MINAIPTFVLLACTTSSMSKYHYISKSKFLYIYISYHRRQSSRPTAEQHSLKLIGSWQNLWLLNQWRSNVCLSLPICLKQRGTVLIRPEVSTDNIATSNNLILHICSYLMTMKRLLLCKACDLWSCSCIFWGAFTSIIWSVMILQEISLAFSFAPGSEKTVAQSRNNYLSARYAPTHWIAYKCILTSAQC